MMVQKLWKWSTNDWYSLRPLPWQVSQVWYCLDGQEPETEYPRDLGLKQTQPKRKKKKRKRRKKRIWKKKEQEEEKKNKKKKFYELIPNDTLLCFKTRV